MYKTECNCDLPLWAYSDWLQEQGWSDFDIEEFEAVYVIYNDHEYVEWYKDYQAVNENDLYVYMGNVYGEEGTGFGADVEEYYTQEFFYYGSY
jgi:hypothetical protein